MKAARTLSTVKPGLYDHGLKGCHVRKKGLCQKRQRLWVVCPQWREVLIVASSSGAVLLSVELVHATNLKLGKNGVPSGQWAKTHIKADYGVNKAV